MRFRLLALAGLFVGLAAPVMAQGSPTIPPRLKGLKPHEVVEQVLNKKADLALSEAQIARLTEWHERVADEPHRFKHDPTKKPHDVTHVAMIGSQEAFDSTTAILNPAQRARLATLFAQRP